MKLDISIESCSTGCYKQTPGALIAPLEHPDMPHIPPGSIAPPQNKRKWKKNEKTRQLLRVKRQKVQINKVALLTMLR